MKAFFLLLVLMGLGACQNSICYSNCKVGYCDPVNALSCSHLLIYFFDHLVSFFCWAGSCFAALGCYLVTSFPPLLPFTASMLISLLFIILFLIEIKRLLYFLRPKANREDYQLYFFLTMFFGWIRL
jgi:hypothetical protein